MVETTRNVSLQLDNEIQFRLTGINRIKDYSMAEIHERKIMIKTLNKYIAVFDYVDNSLLILFATSRSVQAPN